MRRPGFALVYVLLVIAAVELLTLTSLALATHESAVADTRTRTVIAARAADAALASLIKSWPVHALDSLHIGESKVLPAGNQVRIEVQRTGWGLYYAIATGTAGQATIRRAAVLRKLDAARGLAESSEAVVTAGLLAAPFAHFEIDEASNCTLFGMLERTPSLVTVSIRRNALGIPDARVDSAHAELADGYALAGLRWDELPAIADSHASGTIQLTPTDSTGAPFYPLIYAADDLTIAASNGQGLIFVRGNLQIHAGVQFSGIIVVQRSVTIADDVHVHGTLRIQGSETSNISRARIIYSRCAIANALLETPAAARLIRASRTYIPAF